MQIEINRWGRVTTPVKDAPQQCILHKSAIHLRTRESTHGLKSIDGVVLHRELKMMPRNDVAGGMNPGYRSLNSLTAQEVRQAVS